MSCLTVFLATLINAINNKIFWKCTCLMFHCTPFNHFFLPFYCVLMFVNDRVIIKGLPLLVLICTNMHMPMMLVNYEHQTAHMGKANYFQTNAIFKSSECNIVYLFVNHMCHLLTNRSIHQRVDIIYRSHSFKTIYYY